MKGVALALKPFHMLTRGGTSLLNWARQKMTIPVQLRSDGVAIGECHCNLRQVALEKSILKSTRVQFKETKTARESEKLSRLHTYLNLAMGVTGGDVFDALYTPTQVFERFLYLPPREFSVPEPLPDAWVELLLNDVDPMWKRGRARKDSMPLDSLSKRIMEKIHEEDLLKEKWERAGGVSPPPEPEELGSAEQVLNLDYDGGLSGAPPTSGRSTEPAALGQQVVGAGSRPSSALVAGKSASDSATTSVGVYSEAATSQFFATSAEFGGSGVKAGQRARPQSAMAERATDMREHQFGEGVSAASGPGVGGAQYPASATRTGVPGSAPRPRPGSAQRARPASARPASARPATGGVPQQTPPPTAQQDTRHLSNYEAFLSELGGLEQDVETGVIGGSSVMTTSGGPSAPDGASRPVSAGTARTELLDTSLFTARSGESMLKREPLFLQGSIKMLHSIGPVGEHWYVSVGVLGGIFTIQTMTTLEVGLKQENTSGLMRPVVGRVNLNFLVKLDNLDAAALDTMRMHMVGRHLLLYSRRHLLYRSRTGRQFFRRF